jgi:hypothetical protein
MESLRLTAHSIGAIRSVLEDVTVTIPWDENGNNDGGDDDGNKDDNNDNKTILSSYMTIPKGSTLAFCHIVPNTCQSTWSNENVFAAEKFSSQHPQSRYDDEYHNSTTFSYGIRRCPGQDLAMQLVTGLVGLLLVKYEVDVVSSSSSSTSASFSLPPLSFERATLAQRKGPIMVRIRKEQQEH